MTMLSRRVRYALHGMAYMTVLEDGDAVPFKEILAFLRSYSPRSTLSPGYIAKIFQEVSRAGFAITVSGPGGGYRLARPPDKIRLLPVVEALDGPLLSECCLLSAGECPWEGNCGFFKIAREAELAFVRSLEKETLASLVRRMGPAARLTRAPRSRRK